MTDFVLTTGDDAFTGGNGDDLFSGPSGGTDTLRGRGGADTFEIAAGENGSIDGGSGADLVKADGFDLGTLSFANVESLDLAGGGISATGAQISAFASIFTSAGGTDVTINLMGPGGTADFGAKWSGPQSLHIDGFTATGGFTITGTANTDYIAGTDFTDRINGGTGDDQLTGRGGTGDVLNGNAGDDNLSSYAGNSTLNGGADKDTLFAYAGDLMFGGDGTDRLKVKLGGSVLDGGRDADDLRLGNGADTVAYQFIEDSSGPTHDTVRHFDAAMDKIDLWFTLGGIDATVSADTMADLPTALDADHLAAGHAALANIDTKTFLVIDTDGTAGYQPGGDMIVRMDGVVSLDMSNFI